MLSDIEFDRPSIRLKRRLLIVLGVCISILLCLVIKVTYLTLINYEKYQQRAYEQQTRDRLIAPERGIITDRNGVELASNNSASAISVINAQVEDAQLVAKSLAEILEMDYEAVLKKVNQRVALVRIKNKVDKQKADQIRGLKLKGVMVDEDIQRIYPYNDLAANVIGFVGKDNQGIIGLEAKYNKYLEGETGKILTETDARGLELDFSEVLREAPTKGYGIKTTLDVNVQLFAQQTIENAVKAKGAKRGSVIILNPQNGEIYAMASYPSFNLNEPFTINDEALKADWNSLSEKEKNDYLNKMWRNFNINDTYEPGSTFKVMTSAAGLEEGAVKPTDTFNCGGGREVGGRFIKCWRSPRSHGSESFVQGVQNSCNPVFMDVAARLGSDKFYEYMLKFGFDKKTGIDLPGEAVGIMHKKENIGSVELATMSFGQSFQITPMQLLRAISSVINGGNLIVPHFASAVLDENGNELCSFDFSSDEKSVSKQTSEQMKEILESVVAVGTGNKTYIPGYRIGGKTATSEKLPRRSGKYIASFCAFAPSENPQVIALVIIDEPQGVYYGGQVAGPVMKTILSNTLPYLGIEPEFTEQELELEEVKQIAVPSFEGMKVSEAKAEIEKNKLSCVIAGEGEIVKGQFPNEGEKINLGNAVVLYAMDKSQ